MNYVPGTASLIDDIDSKLRTSRSDWMRPLQSTFIPRSSAACRTLVKVFNVFVLAMTCREASGAAPRWKNTYWFPQKHRSVRYDSCFVFVLFFVTVLCYVKVLRGIKYTRVVQNLTSLTHPLVFPSQFGVSPDC